MSRTLMLAGASLALFATTASAQSSSVANYAFGRIPANPHENIGNRIFAPSGAPTPAEQADLYAAQVDQIVRWGKVGRCVVSADHDGSAAFAKTTYPSHAARAAAHKLTPAFDVCFAHAGVRAQANIALRQAAVVDALNAPATRP